MAENTPALPYFDLELLLQTAGETRLGGKEMDECLFFWDAWSGSLSCKTVTAQGRRHLAVWLEDGVENTVDAAWDSSPSRGYLLNALAQTLCMCAVHERIPEIEDAGCAPVPAPDAALAEALTNAGLPARAGDGLALARRYAVVTRDPFGGACEVCALQASCPRAGGSGSVIELG